MTLSDQVIHSLVALLGFRLTNRNFRLSIFSLNAGVITIRHYHHLCRRYRCFDLGILYWLFHTLAINGGILTVKDDLGR